MRSRFSPLFLPLALAVSANASPASSQEDDVILRGAIAGAAGPSWVGQQVRVELDVLARDAWAKLGDLPALELPGAVVMDPGSQGVRLSESIDGSTYTGQRYELWIYPQRAGEYRIDALTLDVRVKGFGFQAEETVVARQLEPLDFSAVPPPETEGLGPVVCSAEFEVEESWTPTVLELRVGDGISREVTRRVAAVPGMALAPLSERAPEGTRVHRKEPRVEQQIQRGVLDGQRMDSITYILQQEGELELPALSFPWWNPKTETLKVLELPARAISVLPALEVPETEDRGAGLVTGVSPWWWAGLGLVAVLAGLTWFVRRHHLLQRLLAQWRASESAAFRRFTRSCRRGDPAESLRTLVKWFDRQSAEMLASLEPAPRLDRFLEEFGGAVAREEYDLLLQSLDGPERPWRPGALAEQVTRARHVLRARDRERQPSRRRALPSLNP